ncbi:MAG: ferredoxin [Alphaproteobacteria bacterium]|jgi:ferredoxin|nr:ferredoxin [Alphaproteobacteria bacterium]|tara:strand:+ start:1085 stop:1318 length:234 start_codon:yes stop_codon:yes gene_type:complete
MIQIVYQRKKCIGCNYCIELAPERWMMNKKDGKSVLLGSKNKKGLYTAEAYDEEYAANKALAKVCPVKVIHINKLSL